MDFLVDFFLWICQAIFLGKTSRKNPPKNQTFWPKSTQGDFCLHLESYRGEAGRKLFSVEGLLVRFCPSPRLFSPHCPLCGVLWKRVCKKWLPKVPSRIAILQANYRNAEGPRVENTPDLLQSLEMARPGISTKSTGIPRKNTPKIPKTPVFVCFSVFFGYFFWGSRISARGLFFRYFLWKFRVGPSRGSVAGRGVRGVFPLTDRPEITTF